MKKYLKLLALCALLAVAASASAADRKLNLNAQTTKKLSTFLSNFTELSYYSFDTFEAGPEDMLHLGAPQNVGELIHCGIWHNYVNNFKSRIRQTKNGRHSACIDAKFVAESVDRYFGLPLKHQNVEGADFYYDGRNYQFEPADGEATYYAQVTQAWERMGVGDLPTWRVTGYIYNVEDKKDRPATFEAFVYPSTWNGKETWIVQGMKTTWK